MADILLGGFDRYGPVLFNIDMFGSVEEKSYVTTGSGSPVAYGLLEMSIETILPLKMQRSLLFVQSKLLL